MWYVCIYFLLFPADLGRPILFCRFPSGSWYQECTFVFFVAFLPSESFWSNLYRIHISSDQFRKSPYQIRNFHKQFCDFRSNFVISLTLRTKGFLPDFVVFKMKVFFQENLFHTELIQSGITLLFLSMIIKEFSSYGSSQCLCIFSTSAT